MLPPLPIRLLAGLLVVAAVQAIAHAQPTSCPANSLFSQPPDDSCIAGTSEVGTGFRRWERFHGVGGPTTGLRWYGLAARPVGGTFIACIEEDPTFEITIARDVAGAPGPVECTYTLVATAAPTGFICGEKEEAPAQYQYEVVLPTPCILVRGWVSIVGMGNPNCWFLWYRSPTGDGASRCEGCANVVEGFDLSLCLLGTPGGVTGACCNEVTALCIDNVAMNDCTAAEQRFTPNTACAAIAPPCGQLVGPCCRPGEPCTQEIEVSCLNGGGQWLGPAATCADCPVVGACCIGSTQCIIIEQEPCLDEGHTWLGPDTICADCPPLPACPATGVLISQGPFDPLDEPSAYTSEFNSPFTRSENFTGATGPITALTWWGLDLQPVGNGFVECTETDNTFIVTFRTDAAGVPGTELCSHTVLATRTPTGLTYHGAQMNEYHAELPSPCVLTRGWVSIVGAGDPSCWFLWMSSPTGDNLSHCAGCSPPSTSADLAVCLHGTPGGVFGACCNDTLITCTDSVEIDDCAAAHQRFSPNLPCTGLDPPCGTILGACCFAQFQCSSTTQADCQAQGGLWLEANSLCSVCPCIVDCPTGANPEGEPLCVTGYQDQFNAGCTSTPNHFRPVAFGDVVCGVGGFYETGTNYQPDQDWYELQVPAALGWGVQVIGELPLRVEIRAAGEGCPGVELGTSQMPATCQILSLDVFSESAGPHWIIVTAYVPNDISACGGGYTLQVNSPYGCTPGDTNQDTLVNGPDVQYFVQCVVTGTSPFNCLCGDMNFDGQTNPGDVPLFVNRLLQD